MSDEFEKIRLLARELGPGGDGVILGIGDDAAVLDGAGAVVLTVDVAVEGIHFRRSFADWATLGRRAYAAAASDIAAMGASPRGALVSLILPADFGDDDLRSIGMGLAALGREIGAPIIGGNLARGSEVSLTTTVVGMPSSATLRRDGAHPGNLVYVTGVVGAAALGLRCLMDSDSAPADAARFIEAWRRPIPRINDGLALAGLATACIDISDGLIQDASHLAKASGVQVRVDTSCLPRASGHDGVAAHLSANGLEAALAGGEDYELLFTLPSEAKPPIAATCIGEICLGHGVFVHDADGRPLDSTRLGFRHF